MGFYDDGDEMQTKTVRIKKVYFDAIADGTKRVEYRADKAYYDWLATVPTPFVLRLHYQKCVMLSVEVDKVRRIKRPASVKLIPTTKVWALSIGRVIGKVYT
jgi:hypothetical protein